MAPLDIDRDTLSASAHQFENQGLAIAQFAAHYRTHQAKGIPVTVDSDTKEEIHLTAKMISAVQNAIAAGLMQESTACFQISSGLRTLTQGLTGIDATGADAINSN